MLTTPPIGVWGANFVGNLGDYAILQGTLRLLRNVLPESRPVVACYDFTGQDKERTATFLGRHGREFDLVPSPVFVHSDRWHRWWVRQGSLRRAANRYLFRKTCRRLRAQLAGSEWISRAPIVLLSGGGHWGWDELTVNLLAQIRVMQDLNKSVFLLPHSMSSKIKDQIDGAISGGVLARCCGVALRDQSSAELARSIGAAQALYCPDCALAVESPEQSNRQDARPGVLLALRALPHRCNPGYMARLAALAKTIEAAGGQPVLFTTCEIDDRLFFDRALVDLPHLAQHRPVSLEEALQLVSQSAAIVTDRFHCMLFGMLAATPVVPVTDLEKVCGMVKTVGWKLTVDNEEALTSRLLLQAFSMRSETVALQNRFVSSARQQLQALSGRLLAAAKQCQDSARRV